MTDERSPATICPRCGFKNSFRRGSLPETCECQVCLSQLDWRDIPGCGPDCAPLPAADVGTPAEVASRDDEGSTREERETS